LVNAWEEEADRRANGRTLALADYYEAHLDSLQKEHRSAQHEFEIRCRDIQTSQAAVMDAIVNTQSSIEAAGKKAGRSRMKHTMQSG